MISFGNVATGRNPSLIAALITARLLQRMRLMRLFSVGFSLALVMSNPLRVNWFRLARQLLL